MGTMRFSEIMEIGDIDLLLTKVQNVCRFKLSNSKIPSVEREDIAQEVAIKVYKALDKFDASKASIDTYLDRVITNKISDCYNSLCKTQTGSLFNNLIDFNCVENAPTPTDLNGIERELASTLQSDDVNYSFTETMEDFLKYANLSDKQMEVFKLMCYGYTVKEIAAIMGVSMARVSKLRSGIKEKYIEMNKY